MRSKNYNSIIDWFIYWIIIRSGAPCAEAIDKVSEIWDKIPEKIEQLPEEIDLDEDLFDDDISDED